jgi:hypothetical protein
VHGQGPGSDNDESKSRLRFRIKVRDWLRVEISGGVVRTLDPGSK